MHYGHQGHATPFKFAFVKGGNAQSVFAKDGTISPHGLVLDDMQLGHTAKDPSVHFCDVVGRNGDVIARLRYSAFLRKSGAVCALHQITGGGEAALHAGQDIGDHIRGDFDLPVMKLFHQNRAKQRIIGRVNHRQWRGAQP